MTRSEFGTALVGGNHENQDQWSVVRKFNGGVALRYAALTVEPPTVIETIVSLDEAAGLFDTEVPQGFWLQDRLPETLVDAIHAKKGLTLQQVLTVLVPEAISK